MYLERISSITTVIRHDTIASIKLNRYFTLYESSTIVIEMRIMPTTAKALIINQQAALSLSRIASSFIEAVHWPSTFNVHLYFHFRRNAFLAGISFSQIALHDYYYIYLGCWRHCFYTSIKEYWPWAGFLRNALAIMKFILLQLDSQCTCQ